MTGQLDRKHFKRIGHRTRNEAPEDQGKVEVSVEGQCRMLLASILWQAEMDVLYYQGMGLIVNGQAMSELPPDGKERRMHAGGNVDMQDIGRLVSDMKSGYWQRWSNALELNHKVDLQRLRLA